MNTPSTNDEAKRPLRTSDLAAAGAPPEKQTAERRRETEAGQDGTQRQRAASTASRAAPSSERLDPLFADEKAARYRARWAEVQSGFVDDPRRAVAAGDELVAEVMKSLAESFAHEREKLESELSHTGEASTETLRVGLRRYRAFFDRLLAL